MRPMLKRPTPINSIERTDEKDERINLLETQVQAFAARASQFKARLLATLDTLDQLQVSHAADMALVEEANRALRKKLNRADKRLKAAESERDDLRDAVLQLIKRVELASDYGSLPCSKISTTALTEPMHIRSAGHFSSVTIDPCPYAPAMVACLRAERDSERRAHTRTLDETRRRITSLEAQVALRDAELEAAVVDTRRKPHLPAYGNFSLPFAAPEKLATEVDRLHNRRMTGEEVTDTLGGTAAKNRALEAEVNDLMDRLERLKIPGPSKSEIDGSPFSRRQALWCGGVTNEEAACEASSPCPTSGRPPVLVQDTPFTASALDEDSLCVGNTRDSKQEERCCRQRSPESSLQLVSQQASGCQSRAPEIPDVDCTACSVDAQPIQQHALRETSDFRGTLLIEQECLRLAAADKELRAKLDEIRNQATHREHELLARIETLMLEYSHSEQSISRYEYSALDGSSEDHDDGGERPMELATPVSIASPIPPLSAFIQADELGHRSMAPQSRPMAAELQGVEKLTQELEIVRGHLLDSRSALEGLNIGLQDLRRRSTDTMR